MFSKWNRFLWKVLPPSFFIALIVTGIYAFTKLEFSSNLFLTFDMNPSVATTVKLYFDADGDGFSEETADVKKAGHVGEFQTLRFAVPEGAIKRIRIDPFSRRSGQFFIRNMKVIDRFEKEIGMIPLEAFVMVKHMKTFEVQGSHWVGTTTPGAYDPQIVVTHEKTLKKALDYPFRTQFQNVLVAHSRLLLQIFMTVLLLCAAVLGLKQKDHQG